MIERAIRHLIATVLCLTINAVGHPELLFLLCVLALIELERTHMKTTQDILDAISALNAKATAIGTDVTDLVQKAQDANTAQDQQPVFDALSGLNTTLDNAHTAAQAFLSPVQPAPQPQPAPAASPAPVS